VLAAIYIDHPQLPRDFVSTRHKPGLHHLLAAIGLDLSFDRATNDFLYYRGDDGREIEVLDLVSGYGTLLLGHNHPELIAAATRFFAAGKVNHAQGSIRHGAQAIACELSRRVGGDYCTMLANSGTEAVEAALKHALLETGGSTLIALQGGFHGKTLGALHATANDHFRKPFGHGSFEIVRVEPNDIGQLDEAFANVPGPFGFLFEPIQGEAGVRLLSTAFLQRAAQWCAQLQIPMIADECQTGLGRTGHFLRSHALGVCPDYIILSKALGGGLAKISALMITRQRYRPDFDLLHSSTFADDEFSSAIALRVLELLDARALEQVSRSGNALREQLEQLQQQYPGVIVDVRGAGLMIGVELATFGSPYGFLLKHFSDRGLLGALVSSYLLNEHQIRVATTLSDPFTLRVQPSIFVTAEQCGRFVAALASVCEKLARRDVVGLTSFLVTQDGRARHESSSLARASTTTTSMTSVSLPSILAASQYPTYFFHEHPTKPGVGSRRVAWIFHLVDEGDFAHLDPALDGFVGKQKWAFCQRLGRLAEPIVMNAVDVQSMTGARVSLVPILLPVTSRWMLSNDAAVHLVQRAIDLAERLGCDVVSLGQFSSIVNRRYAETHAGERRTRPIQITTGSNYTAALARQAIYHELEMQGLSKGTLTLAVIGGGGEIGGTCAAMMANDFSGCLLVGSGRVESLAKMTCIAAGLPRARVATDLRPLRDARVVVCATNSTSRPIGAEHLHPQAIVCDLSVPATLRSQIFQHLPDATIFSGAIVDLPGQESFGIPGFPLPPGMTYGCMGEGLLLGLELGIQAAGIAETSPAKADRMARIAAKHGFQCFMPDGRGSSSFVPLL
jgi:acetylornithine/succinyldiaminopimelate/putrescine aminotransferase/predicted amino acid dehydrogenase